MTIDGLESEGAAQNYVAVVWAGLMWVLLNKNLAVRAETHLQKVVLRPPGVKDILGLPINDDVYGFIEDDNRPVVYPSGSKFTKVRLYPPTVLISNEAANVGETLLEGLSFPNIGNAIDDPKLKVALELYSAYWTEASSNAKFLTLVMVLEALASGNVRTTPVLTLLGQWRSQLKETQQREGLSSIEKDELDALERELFDRRENSLRSQIRSLVYESLASNGDVDASETARQAVKVYDKRSRLVHRGILPDAELAAASSRALNIVERVLKAKFFLAACP